ncbi:unnamed protein product [Trifolium pratense]|uniref:Uncharacterized protein n=1 Tax=Trifolium pratense TaxID=57577 RepID=A0ACB0IKK2_TRIPR|nr:unnamed protein product [Trifolium pratense]
MDSPPLETPDMSAARNWPMPLRAMFTAARTLKRDEWKGMNGLIPLFLFSSSKSHSGALLRLVIDQFLFAPIFIGVFLASLVTLGMQGMKDLEFISQTATMSPHWLKRYLMLQMVLLASINKQLCPQSSACLAQP